MGEGNLCHLCQAWVLDAASLSTEFPYGAIEIFFDPVTHYIRLHPAPRRSAAEDYDVEEDGTIVVDNVEADNGYDENDRI